MSSAPAYAVAHLRDVDLGDEIVEYIRRIDATLEPYGGEFVVHGGPITGLEGDWPGDIVIVRFPDEEAAMRWYESPAYQEILPLRTQHSRSAVAVVRGVPDGYRAAAKLTELT